jgi:hypothetical protein
VGPLREHDPPRGPDGPLPSQEGTLVAFSFASRLYPDGVCTSDLRIYHMNFKLSWPMRGSLALVTKPNWLSVKLPLGFLN